MAHLHLQLFAARLNEIAEDYLRRVNWIYAGTVPEVDHLLRAINATCSKQQFASQRSLVFDDVDFCREILQFYEPVVCCQKTLLNSETLIMHILQHGRDEIDAGTKRLAILFNLYVQIALNILVRYENNYEKMEQFTAQLLRKAAEFLGIIRAKPVRGDASAADTFNPHSTFGKWKYVFDYTCRTCCDTGIDNCRYEGSIAWFKIHQTTLVVNPIRHLGSKMHAARLRNVRPDHDVQPPTPAVSLPRQELPEINNYPQWSKAALYLLEVRESELDKLCFTGTEIQSNSALVEKVRRYLKDNLDHLLGNLSIEPFGSRVTGVANRQSDLDLQIKWKANMNAQTAHSTASAWARNNKREVKFRGEIRGGPMVLRIKILSLDIEVDLTFASPYVVANSNMIKYLYKVQPLARKLFFLLKEWKQRMDISKNFHHHVLNVLILFYMQQENYFPTIDTLLVGPVLLKDNTFNTAFAESTAIPQRPTNLLTLLKNFFAYWAQFDWARNGACLFDGHVRSKESFGNATGRGSVPPMMASDYFEQSRNVAGNIRAGDYQKFVRGCKEAVQVLKMKNSI